MGKGLITYVVCFDYPNLGSRGQRIIQMCREWMKKGYEAQIIVPFPVYHRVESGVPKDFRVNGVRIRRLYNLKNKYEVIYQPLLRSRSLASFIGKVIREEGTDCFVLSQMEPVLAMAVIREAKRAGVPVVSEYMDIVFDMERTQNYSGKPLHSVLMRKIYFRCRNAAHNRLMRKVYGESDMLWLISEYLINEARALVPREKIIKVPPIITETNHGKSLGGDGPHSELDVQLDCIITYAGQFDWPQGVELLLRAFKRFLAASGTAVLLLAGGNYSRVTAVVKGLGLEGKARFLGYVPKDRLVDIYGMSDMLVAPKLSCEFNEAGFSTKVMDYLLSGIPTIASSVGDQGLVFRDQEHLLFFRPGDEDDLLGKMHFVHSNRESARKMGQRGRRFVLEYFDPERVMAPAIEAVGRLISSGTEEVMNADAKKPFPVRHLP